MRVILQSFVLKKVFYPKMLIEDNSLLFLMIWNDIFILSDKCTHKISNKLIIMICVDKENCMLILFKMEA